MFCLMEVSATEDVKCKGHVEEEREGWSRKCNGREYDQKHII